jgi:hypothetical protein
VPSPLHCLPWLLVDGLCLMPYALCFMLYALCFVLYA